MDSEGLQVAVGLGDGHLPEARSEINSGKDSRLSSTDVSDAFTDLLHGVLVQVDLFIESPKVLNNAKSLVGFYRNAENGGVVRPFGASHCEVLMGQ